MAAEEEEYEALEFDEPNDGRVEGDQEHLYDTLNHLLTEFRYLTVVRALVRCFRASPEGEAYERECLRRERAKRAEEDREVSERQRAADRNRREREARRILGAPPQGTG